MEDELKKKLELLIAYAKGADIESILLNPTMMRRRIQ